MLPLLYPFMFPVEPYMAAPAVSYEVSQTYRSSVMSSARAEVTSEHQLKKLDASDEPGSGRKLAIKNFFRRGIKNIAARIRSNKKASKPWKGKQPAVAEPSVEDSEDDSPSHVDNVIEVAESIYSNVTESVPASIYNSNAASTDSDPNESVLSTGSPFAL